MELIEEYRAAHIAQFFPSEFGLYSYNAKVKTWRNPVTRKWEIYLEDQWRLPNDTFRVSFVGDKVKNSLFAGSHLVETLEDLLRGVKSSLYLGDSLSKEELLDLPLP